MNPILVLRSEIICLIILVFVAIISKKYKIGEKNKSFRRLVIFAILHVILDITTVITVNHNEIGVLDSLLGDFVVPMIVNKTLHVFFYLTALGFSSEFLFYVLTINVDQKNRKKYLWCYSFFVIYAVIVWFPFMNITWELGNGTYSSSGLAAYLGYGFAFVNFFTSFVYMITHRKQLKQNIMSSLFSMTFVAILLVVVQVFVRELLFTGAAVTLITVGIFFSNENPSQVFEQRNKINALTQLKTNSEYEKDKEAYNEEFKKDPSVKYIIIHCAIDDLAEVNNNLGHNVGDEYIAMVINCAVRSFKKADNMYRSSGSEFYIIYKGVEEPVVKSDIKAFVNMIKISASNLTYTPSVNYGYAVSTDTNNDLSEVLTAVELSLYNNREAAKSGEEMSDDDGISINVAGLTNYMFDAMLIQKNNTDYPYLLNLKTNVMRITPEWKEAFGLPKDIMVGLPTLWINRIHPNDRQNFIDDFTATASGKQPQHNCDYRAMNKDGKYIKCSCHGAVYDDNGIAVFAGHMYTSGFADQE